MIGCVGVVGEMGMRAIPFGCDGVEGSLLIIEHSFHFVKWVAENSQWLIPRLVTSAW